MASDAVPSNLVSSVIGYQLATGNFQNSTSNLPQRIAIFGEANTDNQSSIDFGVGVEVVSAQKAGELFGFGSPIHQAMRILRPFSGSGVGGIPTVIYPQEEAGGATAKEIELSVTGTATANVTHTAIVAGRRGIDGVSYDFTVNTGDDAGAIHAKIEDAINNVLGCPVEAVSTDYEVTLTTKWKGLTADEITVTIDTNGNDAGLNYSTSDIQSGAGTPNDLVDSLALIGNEWATIGINCYGVNESICSTFEAWNGIPDPVNPTGRYSSIMMKPMIVLNGYTGTDFDGAIATFTATRTNEVTLSICATPNSLGTTTEAAANFAYLYANQAQDRPHLDIQGSNLPDMPTPTDIGDMAIYTTRDYVVKKGCSTVELVAGNYRVVDFVTTYRPLGENPPQFRYVRSLTQDFNMRYAYYILEQREVVNKAIAKDNAPVSVAGVIRPSQWKQILFTMAKDLEARAIITDAKFMTDSIVVNIGTSNPDRFETTFKYKRSGFSRILSTTGEAGFNFNN